MRRILKVLGIVGLVIAGLILAAAVWSRSEDGHRRLAKLIEELSHVPGVFSLEIHDLSGALPFEVKVGRLVLHDRQGPWLSAEKLSADWSPSALLRGTVKVHSLAAETLQIERWPAPDEDDDEPFDWATIPPIRVARIEIPVVVLEDAAVGEKLTASLNGVLGYRALNNTRLIADIATAAGDTVAINLTTKPFADNGEPNDQLDLVIKGNAQPDEWLARRIPDLTTHGFTLDVSGRGPIHGWDGRVALVSTDIAKLTAAITTSNKTRPELRLRFEDAHYGEWRASDLIAAVSDEESGYAIEIDAATLTLSDKDLPMVAGPIRIEALSSETDQGLTFEPLTVSTKNFTADGNLVVGGDEWNLDGTANVSGLGNLIEREDVQGSGRLVFALSSPRDAGLTLHADAAIQGFETAWPVVNALADGAVKARAQVNFDADGIKIETFDLRAANFEASGGGAITDDNVALDLTGSIRDATSLWEPLAGTINITAQTHGPIDAFALNVTALSPDLTASGRAARDARVVANLTGLPGAVSGRIEASGRAPEGKLHGVADFTTAADGAWALDQVAINAPATKITGKLRGGEAGISSADAAFDVRDLGLLAAFAGIRAGGIVTGTASLNDKQGFRINARAERLAWVSGLDPRIETATIALSVRDPFDQALTDGTLAMKGIVMGPLKLDSMDATVERGSGPLAIRARGYRGETQALRIDATATELEQGRRIAIRDLEVQAKAAGFALNRPTHLDIDGDAFVLAPTELRVDGGLITARASVAQNRIDATLNTQDLPLGVLRWFDPILNLQGVAAIDAVAKGPIDAPDLDVHATLSGVTVPALADRNLDPLGGQITLTVANNHTRLVTDLGGFDNSRLRGDIQMGGHLANPAPGAPLTGQLDLDLDIGEFADLLALTEGDIGGHATGQLSVAGTWAEPRPNGEITIADGIFESVATGTRIEDLSATIVSTGSRLVLRDAKATDGADGRIKASGEFDLALSSLSLTATVKKAAVIRLDELEVLADGTVNVDGVALTSAERLLTVTGDVAIDRAWVTIPKRFTRSVRDLEVQERGGGVLRRSSRGDGGGAEWIVLDLKVKAPGRVYVSGRGIDTEWKGKVTVGQTAAAPDVRGKLTTVRGNVELLGKRFKVTDGTVTLLGGKLSPEIDIRAEASAEEITAIVEISGSATAPSISISSVPELPQDEVLARVLFGSDAASLTPMQSLTVAKSIASLSGVWGSGGPGILDRIGGALGVDRVELGGSEGSTLTVGKYISDEIYLSLEQGLTPETSRVRVELELTDSIAIDTAVGHDASSEVGLSWRYDY